MIRLEIKKLQRDINREAAKMSVLSFNKSMDILQVKKYYHLIKNKQQNKLNLLILLQEELFKNK